MRKRKGIKDLSKKDFPKDVKSEKGLVKPLEDLLKKKTPTKKGRGKKGFDDT